VKHLDDIQKDLEKWLMKNFPETTRDNEFKYIVEEVGELSRVDVKSHERIRGYDNEVKSEEDRKDAIGDITISLINYCTMSNLKFSDCLQHALNVVLKRDWTENKKDGDQKKRFICPARAHCRTDYRSTCFHASPHRANNTKLSKPCSTSKCHGIPNDSVLANTSFSCEEIKTDVE
jgi:NTP pyrophosphatase (non-canonical NTP hydrolase)